MPKSFQMHKPSPEDVKRMQKVARGELPDSSDPSPNQSSADYGAPNGAAKAGGDRTIEEDTLREQLKRVQAVQSSRFHVLTTPQKLLFFVTVRVAKPSGHYWTVDLSVQAHSLKDAADRAEIALQGLRLLGLICVVERAQLSTGAPYGARSSGCINVEGPSPQLVFSDEALQSKFFDHLISGVLQVHPLTPDPDDE